jgi:hypothetical protein
MEAFWERDLRRKPRDLYDAMPESIFGISWRYAPFDRHLAEQPDRQNTIDEKAWLQVRHWRWKELEREREIRLKAK